jgi:hypothetical protein
VRKKKAEKKKKKKKKEKEKEKDEQTSLYLQELKDSLGYYISHAPLELDVGRMPALQLWLSLAHRQSHQKEN